MSVDFNLVSIPWTFEPISFRINRILQSIIKLDNLV